MAKASYIHDDFMLETPAAQQLYHEFAEAMPIVDYHCHLPPEQIADDHRFQNMTEAWLGGDHYKWRAMRTNGVDEQYCTGDAPDREKFQKWAETMPNLLRNPLYAWTHLEMARYFGMGDILLGPDTAETVWKAGNQRLSEPGFSARGIIRQSNVRLICTTDDPTDSLAYHAQLRADDSFDVQVLPAWRPDKAMAVEDPKTFNAWVDALAEAADTDVGSFESFMAALRKRHDVFHSAGCRLSDHGLETAYSAPYTESGIREIFDRIRAGRELDGDAILQFKSAMLYAFGVMDSEKDWTQQFHLGCLRNPNSRRWKNPGPDTGFDCIGDFEIARPLAGLLDRLENSGQLTRTIVYNLNPRDNALLVSLIGSFQDGTVPGKMQFGSGWWFLDQKQGMEDQIESLSQLGLLSRFVGMLTDSRSFLSYTRHEYFRRVLCNVLGSDITKGLIPNDVTLVGGMVKAICYGNAAEYFGFDLKV